MGLFVANKRLPIVEPIPIPDTICSGGLQIIQSVGFGARFVLCNRETVYETGTEQLVVCGKMIFPWELIWPGINATLRFATTQPIEAAKSLRLVKG